MPREKAFLNVFVIALARHVFSGLKSIKSFGPPTFRFGY